MKDFTKIKFRPGAIEQPTKPEISQLESGARGGAQGLSFGFADEITGGLESALTDKTYEQARDESRANYDAAQEANPGTYLAGQVGGAVLPMLVPGGQASLLARAGMIGTKGAATVAGMAGQAALQGGLQGLGESKADNLADMTRDTLTGATIGGVTGGVLGGAARGLGKLGSAAVDALPSTGAIREGIENRAAGMITGLNDEGVNVLRNNPNALSKIERLGDVSTAEAQQAGILELGNKLENLPFLKKINDLTDKAYSVLDRSDKTFNADRFGKSIDDYISNNLMVNGTFQSKTEEATANALLARKESLMSLAGDSGIISAKDLKKVINSIRKDIKFEKDAANYEVQGGLKFLQGTIDEDLKNTIPEFRRQMKPLAKAMEMKGAIEKRLYTHGNVDLNKAKTLVSGQLSPIPNLNDQKFINSTNKRFGEIGGTKDLKDFIQTVKMKKMLEGNANQGANMAVTGAAIGGGIGSLVGAPTLGAAAGAFGAKRLEKTGRKLTASYFANQADQVAKQPEIIKKVSGTKYSNVLQQAAQKGSRQFAVTHYLLSQQDPKYRELNDE
jgi:hypothetical protein